VTLDDFLEIFGVLQLSGQFKPILLDDLLAEIVAESLNESQYSVIELVGIFEALHSAHFLHRLQHQPALAQLPLQKLAPEHQSEKCLVF
jgi:hypothetical protein